MGDYYEEDKYYLIIRSTGLFNSIMFFYYSLYDGAKDKTRIKEQFEKSIASYGMQEKRDLHYLLLNGRRIEKR